jgi:O-antigen/teichoic acid export membrane protein
LPDGSAAGWRRLANSEFVRHGALIFASTSLVNVLSFAFHVLVSRRLGVAAYGSLNALLAGLTIFAVPSLILATIVVKYAAEFRALGDARRLRALTVRVATGLSAVALGVALAGAAASPLIGAFLHVSDLGAIVLTIAMLALNLVLPALRGILQGIEDFRAFAISAVVEAAVKIVLAVGLTAIGWGLRGALAAWLFGTLVAFGYTGLTLWLRYRGIAPVSLLLDFARLVRTSAGVAVAMFCVTSLTYVDVIVVKHVFDAETAGLYGATALAGKMLFYLVGFVPAVLLPRAANLALSGKPVLPVLLQALGMVAVLAGGGLFLYASVPALVVSALAGGAFVAAAPLLFPYGVAATLLAALNTVVLFKLGIHRFDFVVPLAAIALLELIAIALFHDTPQRVIQILIVANACGLLAVLYRVAAPPTNVPSGAPLAPRAH